jgi:hypothetical protein
VHILTHEHDIYTSVIAPTACIYIINTIYESGTRYKGNQTPMAHEYVYKLRLNIIQTLSRQAGVTRKQL